VQQALDKIPHDYVDKCVQKSLAWCYKRHEEMRKAGWGKGTEPKAAAATEDIMDGEAADFLSDIEEES
jgi:hypothetical protein